MFTELMIFAAFYAVAFVAHSLHGRFAKGAAPNATTHRFALIGAALAKVLAPLAPAMHEYAVHLIVYSGYVLKGH